MEGSNGEMTVDVGRRGRRSLPTLSRRFARRLVMSAREEEEEEEEEERSLGFRV